MPKTHCGARTRVVVKSCVVNHRLQFQHEKLADSGSQLHALWKWNVHGQHAQRPNPKKGLGDLPVTPARVTKHMHFDVGSAQRAPQVRSHRSDQAQKAHPPRLACSQGGFLGPIIAHRTRLKVFSGRLAALPKTVQVHAASEPEWPAGTACL